MTVSTVPFSKLVASDAINARAASKDGIDELAASIAAKGIIQPLCVRAFGDRYEVIDGRRRLQAIAKLVKDKTWKKTDAVPVLVRDEDDAKALETSLTANVVRLPMHPVDQFAVFARLEAGGNTPADLASRFGVPVRVVRQRLALGKLAPAVLAAWKAGKIDDKTAQAFCLHTDHQVQASLYERLAKERHYGGVTEWRVRQELATSRERVDQSDELALIGEDDYLAAGGTIGEDLFDEARYVDDVALAKKLARERLLAECDTLLAAGWAWASIEDTSVRQGQWWQWDNAKGEDFDAEQTDYDPAAWTAEEKARSGCMVRIISDNPGTASVQIIAGLIRPDPTGQTDLESAISSASSPSPRTDGERVGVRGGSEHEPCPDCAGVDSDDCFTCHGTGTVEREDDEDLPTVGAMTGTADDDDEGGEGFEISQALAQTLSEMRTVAAAASLGTNPDLAMRIITAALTARFMAPANVSNQGHHTVRTPSSGREHTFAQRLATVLALDQKQAAAEFAAAVASTLDLTEGTWRYKGRDTGIDALVASLPADAFTASAREVFDPVDYFRRANKSVALAALGEMTEAGATTGLAPEDVLAGMKKGELTEAAASHAKACGWLPPELRHIDYALVVPEPATSRLTGKVAASEQSSEAA